GFQMEDKLGAGRPSITVQATRTRNPLADQPGRVAERPASVGHDPRTHAKLYPLATFDPEQEAAFVAGNSVAWSGKSGLPLRECHRKPLVDMVTIGQPDV